MLLFPAIDLRGGHVVRLYQGDYDRQTTYGDDPIAQAMQFADAGASWLHLVDLDGARTGQLTQLAIIEKICRQTPLKVELGGGVRSTQTIDRLLDAGVQRVILGTAALKNWDWFADLARHPKYHQRLVLGLDAKNGMLAVSGWEAATTQSAIDVAKKVHGWPLGAIVYTDIATDGTLQGPNVAATQAMAQASDVPVIASGGVGTLEHLMQLRSLPLQGVIVGKAIYENRLTVRQAIDALSGKSQP